MVGGEMKRSAGDEANPSDAESSLREAGAAGLRMLADRVPVIVWSTDENLRFTSLTGAGLAALELQPGSLVGVSLRDYFGLEDPDAPMLAAHLRARLLNP